MRGGRKYVLNKIWLVPKKKYVLVRTYDNLMDMHEGASTILEGNPVLIRKAHKAAACFIGLNCFKGRIGYVLFNLEHLDLGQVAHEFSHAALFSYRKFKNRPHPITIKSSRSEESIMDQIQDAVNQYSNKYITKIYPK